MEAACNAKDAQLSRVSSHLHSVAANIAQQTTVAATTSSGFDDDLLVDPLAYPHSPSHTSLVPSSSCLSYLPTSSSSYLSFADRSHTLRRSALMFHSTMCVAVIQIPNGLILDVNDRMLACTSWRRSDLLGTSMDNEDMAEGHPISPFVTRQRTAHGKVFEYLPQYPAAMAEVNVVVSGQKRKADSVWRCRMGDGTVFECSTTMWAEYDERPDDEPGVLYGMVENEHGAMCVDVIPSPALRPDEKPRRSPDRMMLVFAIEDAVIIEKLEAWSIDDD